MRNGFTLIELLIVLAIFSVTMAIIVPTFSMVSSAQVAVAAKDTLRLMRYARNMALQTQQPVTLEFSPGHIRVSSPFDPSDVAPVETKEEDTKTTSRKKALPNALQAGGIDTVALSKAYDMVAFEFLGFSDSVRVGISERPSDFTRRGQSHTYEEEESSQTQQETFSITVRANGTTRPFSIRVYEQETDKRGDIVSFDFLCSGTIGAD